MAAELHDLGKSKPYVRVIEQIGKNVTMNA
jgi:hypothetical protein